MTVTTGAEGSLRAGAARPVGPLAGSPTHSCLDQGTNPLKPTRDHLERVLVPQLAIEELERKRTVVTNLAQIRDHARQGGRCPRRP